MPPLTGNERMLLKYIKDLYAKFNRLEEQIKQMEEDKNVSTTGSSASS